MSGDFVIGPRLRTHVQGVVLCNVVFVHVTDVLSVVWLLPLYALTLAAPFAVRLQPRLDFRVAWNVAVLAIFSLLVHHASSAGVRFLLEDGLILAAFCQVHLLHNLGERQRPDLLFFNSFLIALVTSFFCQAAIYAGVFAVYAVLLTSALVRGCAAAHGTAGNGLVRDAATKAAVALAVTTVLFLVLPRDFHREGLVADRLAQRATEVGYSEEVRLGRSEHAVATDRVAMRVRLLAGAPADVPEHWRGATLVHYDRGRWRPSAHGESSSFGETPWEQRRAGHWARPETAPRARLEVELVDRQVGRLFAPLPAAAVGLTEPVDALVVPRADGTLLALPGATTSEGPLRYVLAVGPEHRDFAEAGRHPRSEGLAPLLEVPDGAVGAAGLRIARRVASRHRGTPQHVLVEAMRRELAGSYSYLPPGARGAAADLGSFLEGAAGGHCEFFATALALLLRLEGVPCRLATGWLVARWNLERGTSEVRARDAHAWVEVLDPAGFWYAVDATPASSAGGEGDAGVGEWLLGSLRRTWQRVTGFDSASRQAALRWLAALPGRLLDRVRSHPAGTALLLAAGWLVLGLRRRRRRHEPAAVAGWRRAVARSGLRPRVHETPRELLARARREGIAAPKVDLLAAATREHERARYGG